MSRLCLDRVFLGALSRKFMSLNLVEIFGMAWDPPGEGRGRRGGGGGDVGARSHRRENRFPFPSVSMVENPDPTMEHENDKSSNSPQINLQQPYLMPRFRSRLVHWVDLSSLHW
ncbi:hypothetical protein GWI33_003566 [Rhynchophorus ferrugineus]|uniref:Uncharacterized protein n=1 Tax=Rhynchophorus ferrugineus TaxID=354439 RepID=A0A834HX10_RHYFE|nr:hypothetical protein GWI33_003566 [Rhynchophorus ferrugineus]